MEPPARSRGPRSRSTGTVTVAELLARYTGAVLPTPPPGTGYAVSVPSLLRREGRGPHMADRPLLPRGHVRLARALADPPRHNVRRAAAAAGALFAATAVLGPSMVDDGSRGLDTDLALPLVGLPDSPAFDWFGDTARAGSTAPEELASATARQLIAGAIPSEVDGSVLEDIAGPRDPSTPDRTQGGSTGPVAASGSGTIPPGGSGTPPGGTWSWPFGPAGSPAAPAGAPADGRPGEGVSGGGPAGGTPAGGGGIDGPGGEGPGVSMALSAPTVTSPPVHVPSTSAELPVAGLFRSPAVTAGKGVLAPPGVRAALRPDGVEVGSGAAAFGVPDLAASDARVGPFATSGAAVATPDVGVSGARVALTPEAPEVTLPEVGVSATKIETPDLALGSAEVALPDAELPAVHLGGDGVPLGPEVTGTSRYPGSWLRGGDRWTGGDGGTASATNEAEEAAAASGPYRSDTGAAAGTEAPTAADGRTGADADTDPDTPAATRTEAVGGSAEPHGAAGGSGGSDGHRNAPEHEPPAGPGDHGGNDERAGGTEHRDEGRGNSDSSHDPGDRESGRDRGDHRSNSNGADRDRGSDHGDRPGRDDRDSGSDRDDSHRNSNSDDRNRDNDPSGDDPSGDDRGSDDRGSDDRGSDDRQSDRGDDESDSSRSGDNGDDGERGGEGDGDG